MDGDSVRPLIVVRIQRHHCPYGCGWIRDYTLTAEWMKKVIVHPLYGAVTNQELVQIDIQNHDCVEARNARLRMGRRLREHAEEYAAASVG